MNIFKKRARNAKTAHPDAYYQSKRQGIWVPIFTKLDIERYAKDKDRSFTVAIDDLVASIAGLLPGWAPSTARNNYLQQPLPDQGVKMVHVSAHAMEFIGGYAKEVGIRKGKSLRELIDLAMAQIATGQRKEKRAKAPRRRVMMTPRDEQLVRKKKNLDPKLTKVLDDRRRKPRNTNRKQRPPGKP